MDHPAPFHCCTRVLLKLPSGEEEPTAHASFDAIESTLSRNVKFGLTLGPGTTPQSGGQTAVEVAVGVATVAVQVKVGPPGVMVGVRVGVIEGVRVAVMPVLVGDGVQAFM